MNDRCREFQEQFPLLFVEKLENAQRAELSAHLRECGDCSKVFQNERQVMQMAKNDSEYGLLADHPENQELIYYAEHPDRLTAGSKQGIEEHLEKCQTCTEILKNLRALPAILENLVGAEKIPALSSLEIAAQKGKIPATITDIARRVLWHPIVGYAAAAAILLIAIIRPPTSERIPIAMVEVRIPTGTRGASDNLVFESPTVQSFIKLSYYLSPESGHQYDLSLIVTNSGSVLFAKKDFRDFDSRGNLELTIEADTGKYTLEIEDIIDTDTLTIAREFRILLKQ